MKALKNIKPLWLFIAWLLISCGQNKNQQEQTFVQEVNHMLEWPEDGFYSDEIMRPVFDYIRNNPQSLEFEFKENPQCMRIATSDDGRVRAYCLERNGFEGHSSSEYDCKTMIQFRSSEDVFCKVIDDFDGYIISISHIDLNKYYLLKSFQRCETQGTIETYNLYVYKVENNELHKVKGCFANRDETSENLEFSWKDFGGPSELDMEDYAFVYNKFNKELFALKGLPKIGELFKYRQYRWNKQRFEYRKYDEPKEFYNKEYYIRIEQQSDSTWTYKCWNGGEKHGEPNLVIKNGTKQFWLCDDSIISYDEWWTDDESSPNGEKYTFLNNGYRYVFFDGWSHGRQMEDLIVYDNEEEEIYSGIFWPELHPRR